MADNTDCCKILGSINVLKKFISIETFCTEIEIVEKSVDFFACENISLIFFSTVSSVLFCCFFFFFLNICPPYPIEEFVYSNFNKIEIMLKKEKGSMKVDLYKPLSYCLAKQILYVSMPKNKFLLYRLTAN